MATTLQKLSSQIHRLSPFARSLIVRTSATSAPSPSLGSKKVSDRIVKLSAINPDGYKKEIIGLSGQTLLCALTHTGLIDPASHRLEDIEACSAECEVQIAEEWLEKLPLKNTNHKLPRGPYIRGYYRCSSSKGCPARKQVERSRVDPSKLMITYACDHNHPFPSSAASNKSHHHHHRTSVVLKTAKKEEEYEEEEEVTAAVAEEPAVGLDLSHVDSPLLLGGCYSEIGEFGWFYDASISSSSGSSNFLDVTLERGFSVGEEEDESLFGDLGDLPDCASVFRRGTVATEEQHRRCDFGAIPFCDSSR